MDAYLPISEALHSELLDRGIPAERILVARDGADLSAYGEDSRSLDVRSRWAIPATAFVVGFTGHAYRDRGVDELLSSSEHLDPSIHFLIAGGTDEDLRRLEQLARKLGCIDRTHFTGHLPPADVAELQLASDVLAIPYTSGLKNAVTASPLKLFEYLAAGKPIVSTDLPCVKEVLTDGENALLVPPDSGSALAAAIARLFDDRHLGARLGQHAQELGRQFSWGSRAQAIISFLERRSTG